MKKFLRQVNYACNGIAYFLRHERNAGIQCIIAITVVVAGFICCLPGIEWCIILVCIALVLGFEMLNTAIEKGCDLINPDYHPGIKTIKDVAAGAVLCAAIMASIAGAIIFIPHIISYV